MSELFKCPVAGCERSLPSIENCEEVPLPPGMDIRSLKRKPLPKGILMRTFLINCPEHGERYVQKPGHHTDTIPKRLSRKKRAGGRP
jgi:hypothetical protein